MPEARLALVGLSETIGPFGETDAERVTVPAKLLMLDKVIALVVEDPWLTVTDEGDEEMLKSL